MLNKELYHQMKRFHKKTGVGLLVSRNILERIGCDYDKALAYLITEEKTCDIK